LKDRFILVQSGIVDKRDDYEIYLKEKIDFCDKQEVEYNNKIDDLNKKLRQENTKMAQATGDQNDAEVGSHAAAGQHRTAADEYMKTMKECCDNKNTFKSEICALTKIRGEINNIEGGSVTFITDCAVSEWVEEKCSKECGGGKMVSKRDVTTHKAGQGRSCPKLSKVENCNEFGCNVDCVMGEWGMWSECSAECGGGVMERSRDIVTQKENRGKSCESTEDEKGCHMGSCNADCKLSEWTEWGMCSRHCGGGTQKRVKTITEPKRGTGECWEDDDLTERLNFRPCNEESCDSLLAEGGKELWTCDAPVDVEILMDSSGSLGYYGWWLVREATATLLQQLDNGMGNAMVGVEVFSGPNTWDVYEKCVDSSSDDVNIETDCKIKTLQHPTMDIQSVIPLVKNEPHMDQSTLTSVALGVAEQELKYSRENATSVVIVITDGQPISQKKTKEAATALKENAKVIWVAIGGNAPVEMIEELASLPKDEYVIKVDDFDKLEDPYVVTHVVADICPMDFPGEGEFDLQ